MTFSEKLVIFWILVLAGLILGLIWHDKASCEAKAKSFVSVDWGPVQGCMVLHRGRWLPLENIRGFE